MWPPIHRPALFLILLALGMAAPALGRAAAVEITYLSSAPAQAAMGARLAVAEANARGRYTGRIFVLREERLMAGGDPVSAFVRLVDGGARFFLLDLPAEVIAGLAQGPRAGRTLMLNISAPDDFLRSDLCRANLLHVVPSGAMIEAALAAFPPDHGPNLEPNQAPRVSGWALGRGPDAAAGLAARFLRFSGKPMTERSHAAWLAVLSIARASERVSGRLDPAKVARALTDGSVRLSGRLGRALSFRPWSGQLRRPLFRHWKEQAGPELTALWPPLGLNFHPDQYGLPGHRSTCGKGPS